MGRAVGRGLPMAPTASAAPAGKNSILLFHTSNTNVIHIIISV